MDALAQAAMAGFGTTFAGAAPGAWAAPGRVNLIGEHTDYNDGFCLPIALPRRTVAAAARRDDGRARIASADMDGVVELEVDAIGPGSPEGWAAYGLGVLWALRRAGHDVGGLDVFVSSDVPLGAGLSSSAALEGCVAAAASDLYGLGLLADDAGRRVLVDACRAAENEVAGAPTGGMDQTAALRSLAGHALLLDCRDGAIEQVPFAPDDHGLALLVVNTNAKHALVDGQYGRRRAVCEEAARTLGVDALRDVAPAGLADALAALPDDEARRRTRHVVTEIARVGQAVDALRSGRFDRLGQLFYASHESLRVDFEVSSPELDAVVDVARAGGALGARMTGGGFGGSAIVLARREDVDALIAGVEDRYAAEGWAGPECFAADAGAPAERVG